MKLKGILGCLSALLLTCSLSSCDIWGSNGGTGSNEGCSGLPGKEEWTLDDVNEFLNSTKNEGGIFDPSNTVAVIPFDHINGPRLEWSFFALVNFEYDAAFYWKYQVTFLSCTCRSADVNYWSTVFLTLTSNNASEDDLTINKISFEKDDTNHYDAGFWGDSNPIPGSGQGTGPMDNESGSNMVTYDDIKTGLIDPLEGITWGELKNWTCGKNEDGSPDNLYDHIDQTKHPEIYDSLTKWTGASVSTNNIVRLLQAVCKYHISKGRA